jgi:hypothetical protein
VWNTIARPLSLLFFGALLLSLSIYPIGGSWLPAILLAYMGLLWWRPALWLFALPALLPVLDLAPRTGWFFLEEIDLLLMASAGFCYWRLKQNAPSRLRSALSLPYWPPLFRAGMALLVLACAIGLWRGLRPLPAIDANAFNNYLSPYNALRVGKAWLWTLIFLPPLRQAAGPQLQGLRQYLLPGMLTGFFLVVCFAIRERLQFPGLLNFSSNYRITAPFSAMHTGGAALDGFLALGFPLLAIYLFGRYPVSRTVSALIILPMAVYAGLATFSRGLYLAYAVAVAIIVCLPMIGLLRRSGAGAFDGKRWRQVAVALAVAVPVLIVLNAVFSTSGYRGYAAALVLLAAMLLLSAQALRPLTLVSGLICGLGLACVLGWLLPVGNLPYSLLKAPYLLFIFSALAFVVALTPTLPAPQVRGPAILPLAALAYGGLLLTAVWIAMHNAGDVTLAPSAGLMLLALLPIAFNLVRGKPLWNPSRRSAIAALAGLLILGSAVPIYNGYFVAERFATSGNDFGHRWRHWRQALAMMNDDAATVMLGMGLGTFPATYYWRNHQGELPPSYRYLDRDGNRYLRLSAGEYPAGYGEMLRLLQTVKIAPESSYLLGFDVSNSGPPVMLHLNLCERQLLYPRNCRPIPLRQIPTGQHWQHYQFALQSGVLGATSAPVTLEISAEGQRAVADIDNLSLRNTSDNHELLRNGNFSEANSYWFFSSDRYHLPWHIKNLVLNLYFEMGWPGLLAYATLLFSTIGALLRRGLHERGGCEAAAWLAALIAFQIVGLFDSLLDVPRITLLFMLMLSAAALEPAPLPISVKSTP